MIRNVFIPEKIGSNYLFSKRIVGIDIGKTHIYASVLRVKGTTRTIELCVGEQLEAGPAETHGERTINALKKIFQKCAPFDEVRTTVSSSTIIFKELKLPFINYQKIKMVIGFEIEPLLPFSLNNAVVDFIITSTIEQEQSSIVLAAAAQKQHIAQHLELFAQVGVNPAIITVDLFELYALYKETPTYLDTQGSAVLFDFGMEMTRLAYIDNGQLKLIRTIGQGLFHIAKRASKTVDTSPDKIMEHLIRFGLEQENKPEYTTAIKQAMVDFWDKVRFTLTSFATRGGEEPINQVLLLGDGAKIKEILPFASENLGVPCALFDGDNILKNPNIASSRTHAIPPENIMSISTALPCPITEHFNLRKNEFAPDETKALLQQIIVAGVLLLVLLVSVIAHTTLQPRKLVTERQQSEQEALDELKGRFKGISEDETVLDEDIIRQAQSELKKEEQQWFAFSSQARSSILQYLLELTTRNDNQALGFSPERITIDQNRILLTASVKSFDALKILERELKQSKMLSSVAGLEEPKFTATITLKRSIGEE